MAYNDVMRVSYARLKREMETDKPFKNTNAYPLGERRYSRRHFRMREDGAFTLHDWHLVSAEKDKHDKKHMHYYTLAVVHPDNSFEYTAIDNLGSIQFLCALAGGVTHSKVHGGHMHFYKKWHPLFMGLRINLDTHEAVTPYVLKTRVLNKKLGKEYLRQFEVGKQVGRHMLNAMDANGRVEVCADVVKEYGVDTLCNEHVTKLMVEGKYADAIACSLMLDNNWHYIRAASMYKETGDNQWPFHIARIFGDEFIREVDTQFKGKLDDSILRGSTEVFKYSEPRKMGDIFPSSKWGYSLQDLDGNNLVRI